MKKTLRILSLVLAALFIFTACKKVETPPTGTGDADTVEYGTIPQVSLKFATEPYPDHTIPYIAVSQGWFEDVGITLSQVDSVDADKLPSVMVAGSYDFASGAPSLFIPSMRQANFTTFCFSNLFLGYSIMAPAGTKTYGDFIARVRSLPRPLSPSWRR